jgi:hypothetical protein
MQDAIADNTQFNGQRTFIKQNNYAKDKRKKSVAIVAFVVLMGCDNKNEE